MEQWSPLAYSFLRLTIGALLCVLLVRMLEGSVGIARRDLPLIAAAAVIGIVINQVGFMYATTYTTATTISLVLATIPAFTAIAASVAGHERIGGRHWLGIAIAGLGVVLVLRGGGARLDLTSLRGDLLALVAAASWGIYAVMIRPLLGRYSPNRISTAVLVAALPMMAVICLPQLIAQDYGAISGGGWAALAYSLVFSLVLSNMTWFGAIHRGGASRAAAVLPLQPFLGAVFAFILLGETLTPLQIAGGAVVVGGIWLTR
jgi:drug/metabolite transporter (DMT)-like permease